MIKYRLACAEGHNFDAWFASAASFDEQQQARHLGCPVCGGNEIDRALMAPAVARRDRETGRAEPAAAVDPPAAAGAGGAALRTEGGSVAMAGPSDSGTVAATEAAMARMVELMRAVRSRVLAEGTNVGEQFPEEARKIHYGESETRPIYGQADADEARALLDEGISILPLPVLPEDHH